MKYWLMKPIINRGGCNLSFAGLKTAVLKISKTIKSDKEKYKLGINDSLDFPAKPRWSLDEKAIFLKGAGVKL